MIREMSSKFRDFSFTSIRKYKNFLIENYHCSNCIDNVLSTVCYLRAHTTEFPNTRVLCKYLAQNLTPEMADEYDDYPRLRSHIYEDKLLNKGVDPKSYNSKLYDLELDSSNYGTRKMNTRDFPNINLFPTFDVPKESKMFLTELDPPNKEQISNFRHLVGRFIKKYGPSILPDIPHEVSSSYSSSWYSDYPEKRRDYEKPRDFNAPFQYQAFWTSPVQKREVWLPNKNYKTWSTIVHNMCEPILRKCNYVICNDTITEIRKDLFNDIEPMKKIDLKGFGLQFPREYILEVLKEIEDIYNIDNISERVEMTFGKITIKDWEIDNYHPKRGVGLGYFNNAMVLSIAAILEGLGVKKMFSDDILIKESNYSEAIRRLESFSFIINEKKSGEDWHLAPFFAGVTMTKRGQLRHHEAQSYLCASFRSRYHSTRKTILSQVKLRNRNNVLLDYARCFPHEYKKNRNF